MNFFVHLEPAENEAADIRAKASTKMQ